MKFTLPVNRQKRLPTISSSGIYKHGLFRIDMYQTGFEVENFLDFKQARVIREIGGVRKILWRDGSAVIAPPEPQSIVQTALSSNYED